jgi:hypothetical protein
VLLRKDHVNIKNNNLLFTDMKKNETSIKNKKTLLLVSVTIIILCIISGTVLWYMQRLELQKLQEAMEQDIYTTWNYKEYDNNDNKEIKIDDKIKILEVKEGDCENTLEKCTADILVKKDGEEFVLENISFSGKLSVEEATLNPQENEPKYYILDFGTSNCRSSYLFGQEFVSEEFSMAKSDINRNLFWEGNYIFEDCGIVGYNIEMITGLSMLNLNSNKLTKILEPETLSNEEPVKDISFFIGTIIGDKLIYQQCLYGTTQQVDCGPKELILTQIVP